MLDPNSPIDVYGSVEQLDVGLNTVVRHLDGGPRDGEILRYLISLIHLQSRLQRQPRVIGKLRSLIEETGRQREHLGIDHPQTISRLADVYQQTISTLGPRIVVRGDGTYLRQPAIVAHIRALLLAGIRAAVLWQQVGGRRRNLFLKRRAICRECESLMATVQ